MLALGLIAAAGTAAASAIAIGRAVLAGRGAPVEHMQARGLGAKSRAGDRGPPQSIRAGGAENKR